MQDALRRCALLMGFVVFGAAVPDVNITDAEFGVTNDNVTTSPNATDYIFVTGTIISENTSSLRSTGGVAESVSMTALDPNNNTSDATSTPTFSETTTVPGVSEYTDTVNMSQSFQRAMPASSEQDTSSGSSIPSSSAIDLEVTTNDPSEKSTLSSGNETWSSFGDATSSVTLTSCEMTTERRLSVIQSPGFPSPYAPEVECRYAVKRYSLDVCSVTFLFNVFDLEPSEACSKDYVDLHGERLCGAKTTGLTRSVPFRSIDDQVILRFRSDDSISGVGFMATVVQQECPPPDCDHQFTGIKFELRSPGFPNPYENRQLCDYTVVRAGPRICRIRLQVQLFDVEAADHCDADSLEIRGDKLCGNIPAGEIVSVDFREPLLMLRFRSDHTTTRDGFHLLGTQEECSDDDVNGSSVNMTEKSER